MINSIKLANFKAFGDEQEIPIKPLTLIFGPNSSGKSSIIHSLLLMHHLVEKGVVDIRQTYLGGNSVDLGGFRQFVHRNDDLSKVRVGFEIPTEFTGMESVLKPTKKVTFIIELGIEHKETTTWRKTVHPETGEEEEFEFPSGEYYPVGIPRIESHEIYLDGEFLIKTSPAGDRSFRIARYNYKNQIFNNLRRKIFPLCEHWKGRDKTKKFEKIFSRLMPLVILSSDDYDPDWHDLSQDVVTTPNTIHFEEFDNEMKSGGYDIYFGDTWAKNAIALLQAKKTKIYDRDYLGSGWLLSDYFSKFYEIPREELKVDSEDISLEGFTNFADLLWVSGMFFVLIKVMGSVAEHVEWQLSSLSYLGPIRSNPPREITSYSDEDPNYLPGGGFAWRQLLKSQQMREVVNAWLGSEKMQTPYEINLQSVFSDINIKNVLEKNLHEFVYDLMKNISNPEKGEGDISIATSLWEIHESHSEFPFEEDNIKQWINDNIDSDETLENWVEKLKEGNYEQAEYLTMLDKRTGAKVSHRDVGMGVSQVIPVLVSALGNKNKILAMEQPEIHLHPGLQSELADVFIKSALSLGNTFVLETHSEHMILRILRRIRETYEKTLPDDSYPIKPEDVAILYVKPTGTGAKVYHMEVTPEGDFAEPWPDGFFAERIKELM